MSLEVVPIPELWNARQIRQVPYRKVTIHMGRSSIPIIVTLRSYVKGADLVFSLRVEGLDHHRYSSKHVEFIQRVFEDAGAVQDEGVFLVLIVNEAILEAVLTTLEARYDVAFLVSIPEGASTFRYAVSEDIIARCRNTHDLMILRSQAPAKAAVRSSHKYEQGRAIYHDLVSFMRAAQIGLVDRKAIDEEIEVAARVKRVRT